MTYDEAARHATWDEALVYALGSLAREQGFVASMALLHWPSARGRFLEAMAPLVKEQSLSRELTLADRDPYEFRLTSYPHFFSPGPTVVLA